MTKERTVIRMIRIVLAISALVLAFTLCACDHEQSVSQNPTEADASDPSDTNLGSEYISDNGSM